jgi:hypothetical protein
MGLMLLVLAGVSLVSAMLSVSLLVIPDSLVLPLSVAVGVFGAAGVAIQLVRR